VEGKRIKMLTNIVTEIEWLQLENNFCAFQNLNHMVVDIPASEQQENASFGSSLRQICSPIEEFNRQISVNFSPSTPTQDSHRRSTSHDRPSNTVLSPKGTSIRRRIRYNSHIEFTRQGVLLHPAWRESTANTFYSVCPTYPCYLIVPKSIRDDVLIEASKFRSKRRVPVLTWIHPRTGAALCRSSQPKSGILRLNSKEDKELILAIRDAAYPPDMVNGAPKRNSVLNIVDARPEINAKSNAFAGKGHESIKQYDRDGVACACKSFF